MMKALLAAAVLLAPTAAFARDSTQYVCSAVVAKPADKGEPLGLFVHFYEHRATDGESREEILDTVYQAKLFQGIHLNKDDKAPVAIQLKAGTAKYFDGKYQLELKGGKATLHVVGKVIVDPTDAKSGRAIDAKLPCVDLSI